MRKLGLFVCVVALCVGIAGVGGYPIHEFAPQAWDSLSGVSKTAPEVVVVEETANRTVATASVFNAKEVRDAAKGCKMFRWLDKDASGPSMVDVQWAFNSIKGVSESKLPVVSIRRGNKITVVALPGTPAAMVTYLKSKGA